MALLAPKDSYVAIFTKDINGTITFQGKKKFKATAENITYRKKTFPIDTKKVTYRNRGRFIYFIDVDFGQLVFHSEKWENTRLQISTELIDMICERRTISQLVSGLVSADKKDWITIIIVLALGLVIGLVLGQNLL